MAGFILGAGKHWATNNTYLHCEVLSYALLYIYLLKLKYELVSSLPLLYDDETVAEKACLSNKANIIEK